MQKVRDLRKSFIDFFQDRGHKIVSSSSLVPKDDPSLLFTTAGMVQFKPMFAGSVELEYTRAASIQRCLRTSDLENVGKTKRHMTLFEMLGNFSFGDYFKKEAIQFAWDFSTEVIGFPAEKIWVTIYLDDDEAFEIWNKGIGVPEERIVRLGKTDNFWGPAGETGACGPCSELYLDRGEEFGCGLDSCKPGCECERFMEFWNLVFNQFNQNVEGLLTPLPRTGIDTGMGLERLATLVQDVDSVFDTDEMLTLIDFVSKQTGQKYEGKNQVPIKVIVEHARALTFAMADGIYPSNDGRGYVLRRILRRALRYSRQLGVKDPFIFKLIDPVVNIMGEFYPEIVDSAENIKNVISGEEIRFLETIENGMDRLEEVVKKAKSKSIKSISGKDAFVLYDTFGFPVEMTVEIAEENKLLVDTKEFEVEMENQRSRGKKSWKGNENSVDAKLEKFSLSVADTKFLGYDKDEANSKIVYLLDAEGLEKKSLIKDEEGYVVLDETPFYGEAGGQVGDIGEILIGDNSFFRVVDTKKINKTIFHSGKVVSGEFKKENSVLAKIDSVNRNLIRGNHSCTHLLQAALRDVLGAHVKQAGSIVDSSKLRFDFSHFKAMSEKEISQVEEIVNQKIWENLEVSTKIMNIDEAVKTGAMAVFDEKYDEIVRVVSMGDFSKELCGGTHVSNTGKIGVFKILKESSPGAGIRRIEAITLKGVLDKLNSYSKIIHDLTSNFSVSEGDIVQKILDLSKHNKDLEKELSVFKKDSLKSMGDEILKEAEDFNGYKIITYSFKDIDVASMREFADDIKSKEDGAVIFFGANNEGKATLLYSTTKKAMGAGIDCGKLIKETSKFVKGGGGGRKDMAQAGGKDATGIDQALKSAVDVTKKILG